MNRRQMIISLAGASGTAIAALSCRAAEIHAFESCRGIAYEPWQTFPSGSGIEFAAGAAILAASPHNTQPWQMHIAERKVDLFADPSRTIGAIDPLLREQQIGTGCALENLIVASECVGLGVDQLDYVADARSHSIASVTFKPQRPVRSALCTAIPLRHTNRGPYHADRAISPETIRELEGLNDEQDSIRLTVWTDAQVHERVKEMFIAACEAVVADRQQNHDSALWYRPTRADIDHYRDGVTLEAQGLSPVTTALARLLPNPSPSMADHMFLKRTREVHCGPGSLFATISVTDPASKECRVCVGRLWQRLHLWGTANGLAMQPLNQVHERIDRETSTGIAPIFTSELASLLGESGWHGIFSFRMGYGTIVAKPSPRRSLAQVLI